MPREKHPLGQTVVKVGHALFLQLDCWFGSLALGCYSATQCRSVMRKFSITLRQTIQATAGRPYGCK